MIQLGWRGNTGPCTAPGAPTGLAGAANGLNASFSWSAPASGGALTDYLLEAGRSPGASDAATVTLPASATTFAATGAPGTYYVRVRGRNACGSAVSSEVAVTLSSVCALPAAPGQPSAVVTGPAVAMYWAPRLGRRATCSRLAGCPGRRTC